MTEKAERVAKGEEVLEDPAAAAAGEDQILSSTDPVVLANALRFEQAKSKVLLDEVIALEDEVVNRVMEENDAVVSPETRDFWREQLLTNRAAATVALGELAKAKGARDRSQESGDHVTTGPRDGEAERGRSPNVGCARSQELGGRGKEDGSAGTPRPTSDGMGRRPLHNRAVSRPVAPAAAGGPAGVGAGENDAKAAAIRNRAQEISRGDRVPFSVAFRRAEMELGGK